MLRTPLSLATFALLLLALPAGAANPDPVAQRFAQATAALERSRRGPEGIADLAALAALEDDLSDLGRLAAAYERAAADPTAHPEVRAQARFQLAGLERTRGNLLRSEAHLRRLGFLSGWQVMGPFDDEGKRGLATAFPPEEGIDPGARARGKEREVAWRKVPRDAEAGGFVHLGATLRPAGEVVAYAVTSVVAPRDLRVRLWFGASGAARVWVNGAVAVDDATYHPARLDQHGATVTLRAGSNRILVKLCHQSGRMGFFLRLADERGDGLGLPAGEPFAPAAADPGPQPEPLEDAVAVLERRAAQARGRDAPDAHATLSAILAVRQAGDRDDRRAAAEAVRAAALAPRSVEAQLAAASMEEDRTRRRTILDGAARGAPGDARLLRALAAEELDQDRPQAAALLLQRAIAAAPGWVEPRVALCDALERSGLSARAALLAEGTARVFPTSPAAVRASAHAAVRMGRVEEAIRRERTLLALRFDDASARASLTEHLLDRGDLPGAVALLREAIRLSPAEIGLHLRLGDLLAANGRGDEAEEAYARALELSPEEADGWEHRGRSRLAAGRAREAQEDLSRALALRPQDPALKELARSLAPDEERFWKPYQLDARKLAASAPSAAGTDEDAVVLGELHVTRVLPSGLSSTYTQRIVKVLTARGADAFRRQQLGWSPDRQEARVERAAVLKPDGRVVESHEENVESTSEPWYRLYYDVLARTLSFPALSPGDVLEVAWRIDDTASENLLSDYFGDVTTVDEPYRKLGFDYVLLLPEGRAIHANEPPGVQHALRSLPGGVKEHRYTARDLPRLAPEPGMPGWSEVARTLHLSTYRTWDEVNQFYWRLVRDQIRPTPEIRATAQRIADEVRANLPPRTPAPPAPAPAPSAPPAATQAAVIPATSEQAGQRSEASEGAGGGACPGPPAGPVAERGFAAVFGSRASGGPGGARLPCPPGTTTMRAALVRAAYDFVVSQTRYVGLEFGIHGYKPYRVDQILSRRFGDCKDKASLLHALLEAMGIDSRLVLLRMRRLGRIPEHPASLAVFNHAIVYVPELDLWLDGTAAYSGTGDLPGEDRGANVLVVNPDGPPRFGTIPEARPDQNRLDTDFELALATDGSAAVSGRWRIAGMEAPAYRRAYGVEDGRRALLEQSMGRLFPGARVESVTTSDLSRIEDQVDIRFTVAVPRAAQPDGTGLRFTPFGASAGYVEAYASLSARRHELDLGGPRDTRFRYRYVLPAGWRVRELPDPVEASGPLGGFEVRYREEEGAVVAEGLVRLPAGRVGAAEYPAFRELMGKVDRAFARRIRIGPAEAAGKGAP